jgi:multidrug efflux pump subunit AcrA (membrane-fusion protein)
MIRHLKRPQNKNRRSCIFLALALTLSLCGSHSHSAEDDIDNRLQVVFFPRHEAVLTSEIAAKVVAIHKEMGEAFSKGDELLSLERTYYDNKVKKLEAMLNVAKANLEAAKEMHNAESSKKRAEAELTVARTNLKALKEIIEKKLRIKKAEAELDLARKGLATTEKLYKDNIASAMDIEEARKNLIIAESNIALALASEKTELAQAEKMVINAETDLAVATTMLEPNLKNAHKDMVLAQTNLEDALKERTACTVIAPFDGRVAKVVVHEHEHAQMNQNLLAIIDDSVLLAQFLVPSDRSKKLRKGQTIKIAVTERNNEIVTGTISHIDAVFDPASKSYTVYAEVQNGERKLRAGMSGFLSFKAAVEKTQ